MKVKDIIRQLEERFPLDAAEEWDNPGLLVGREEKDVHTIFVALDLTDDTLLEAASAEADLILTHHPLIFRPVRQINDRDMIGRRILLLAEYGISYYAMHTNFDVCRMADLNERQLGLLNTSVLSLTGERNGKPEGIGRVGEIPASMTLGAFAVYVKEKMKLPDVLVYGDEAQAVARAAVSGGSGKSMIPNALASGADVLVTGDIDYHTAIDAVAQGLSIIDAGHYGTEYIFIEDMARTAREIVPDCEVRTAKIHFPYMVR